MILIDSNIWIFAENSKAEEQKAAYERITRIVKTTDFGINAIITSEVFYKLSYILKPEEAYRRTINIIDHPSAKWLDLQHSTIKRALSLSLKSNMRANDAFIAQQALDLSIPLLTDNVKDFRKVEGLNLIPLR